MFCRLPFFHFKEQIRLLYNVACSLVCSVILQLNAPEGGRPCSLRFVCSCPACPLSVLSLCHAVFAMWMEESRSWNFLQDLWCISKALACIILCLLRNHMQRDSTEWISTFTPGAHLIKVQIGSTLISAASNWTPQDCQAICTVYTKARVESLAAVNLHQSCGMDCSVYDLKHGQPSHRAL